MQLTTEKKFNNKLVDYDLNKSNSLTKIKKPSIEKPNSSSDMRASKYGQFQNKKIEIENSQSPNKTKKDENS